MPHASTSPTSSTPLMEMPTFDAVSRAFEILEIEHSVAETHGLLSAFFAMNVSMKPEAWIHSLRGDGIDISLHSRRDRSSETSKTTPKQDMHNDPETDLSLTQAAEEVLITLFKVTVRQFNPEDLDLDFMLLLPPDEALFEHRVNAFAEWSQGFVSGLNLMNVTEKSGIDETIDEAVSDFMKFSCLIHDAESTTEEDESALAELIEYSRVAVMLIHSHAKALQHAIRQTH